jgi:hypothetical protein
MAGSPDIVVLIPGITGSVLKRDGEDVWGPSAGAVLHGLFSGGKTIQKLRLEHDDPDLDDLGDGVTATALIGDVHLFPKLWKIDGYTKVAQRLQRALQLKPGTSYFELPYDWRRDNRVAARLLQRKAHDWLKTRRETHPDAKLILIGHSMGGLVARYFIECLGGFKDTRTLITFGTPHRGSLNALDSLSNGVRKFHLLDLTELSRSFTSIYQLLPIYKCYDDGRGEPIRLKEADQIPGLDIERVHAADQFHREIEQAVSDNKADAGDGERYDIRPIVGIEQPTNQSARLVNGRVELVRSREDFDEMGDGTVPRVSATPIEEGEERTAFAATRHASLQNADAVLTHVHGLLTRPRDLGRVRAVGAPTTLSLDLEDVYLVDEPIRVAVRSSAAGEPLVAVLEDAETGMQSEAAPLPQTDDEWREVELPPSPPGTYRIIVSGDATRVEPIVDLVFVSAPR